ncbi:MAG: TIGR04438 family Trp-rich protein [Polaromonas sp.]|nr:TIGR04438 family Trp-rich protein [Polaromonas sp.]
MALWRWRDASGYTKKKEIEKMEKRTKDRIEKSREAMGMLSAKRKKK